VLKELTILMFCWPCITVCQYSETNVIHFLFSLLRIKSLLHVSSITSSSLGGATQTAFGILRACYVSWLHQVQPTDIPRTQYTQCRLCSDPWRWGSNVRNV
jgi:hypothetical protein